nr:hypothetical protein [Pseudomonas syringae]
MCGLEAIRMLSQIAEACAMCVLERGHDVELVKFAAHCSDRAEHIAQYLIDSPTTSWSLDFVLEEMSWLIKHELLLERVRVSVMRTIPTVDDLEKCKQRSRLICSTGCVQ